MEKVLSYNKLVENMGFTKEQLEFYFKLVMVLKESEVFATKNDLFNVRDELRKEFKSNSKLLELNLFLKLGSLMGALFTLSTGVISYFIYIK